MKFLLLLCALPASAMMRPVAPAPETFVARVTAEQVPLLTSIFGLPDLAPDSGKLQGALAMAAAKLPAGWETGAEVPPEAARAALQAAEQEIASDAMMLAVLTAKKAADLSAEERSQAELDLLSLSYFGPAVQAAVVPALRTLDGLREARTLASAQELAKRLAAGQGEDALVTARPDLLELLIEAADAALDYGKDDADDGTMSSLASTAYVRLKTLGLPKTELAARARRRVEVQLRLGRAKGLGWGSLDLPAGEPSKEGSPLERNHELSRWEALRRAIAPDSDHALRNAKRNLVHAYRLAKLAGDEERSSEALLQLFQLGAYDRAGLAAMGHAEDLMTTAKLALAEFLNGSEVYNDKHAETAVLALSRVTGPMKAAAAALLKDVAGFVADETFQELQNDNATRRRLRQLAMKALRHAGDAELLREATARHLALDGGLPDEEVLLSLAALNDQAKLAELAAAELAAPRDTIRNHEVWRDVLLQAGQKALLSVFGRKLLDRRRGKDSIFDAARLFADAGDARGLGDARRAFYKDLDEATDEDWDELEEIGRPWTAAANDSDTPKGQVELARGLLKNRGPVTSAQLLSEGHVAMADDDWGRAWFAYLAAALLD